MKCLDLFFGQTFEPFRQGPNPASLPSQQELTSGRRGGDLNRSAVTRRTDALDEFSLYQAFDNPAHGRWADLFQRREFTDCLGAEKYHDRKGRKLRRAYACMSILCTDEPEQADRTGMQSIRGGDFEGDLA